MAGYTLYAVGPEGQEMVDSHMSYRYAKTEAARMVPAGKTLKWQRITDGLERGVYETTSDPGLNWRGFYLEKQR